MTVTTPFRTTPILGPNLTQVLLAAEMDGGAWYDFALDTHDGTPPTIASPQLGVTCQGTDGRTYMWVQASGTIAEAAAPGTQVTVTVTAYDNVTVATGSGGWYAPDTSLTATALVAGDRFWVAKGTAP